MVYYFTTNEITINVRGRYANYIEFIDCEVTTNIVGFPPIEYSAHTIINHLTDYGTLRLEMGYASAIATILFIVMIVANVLVRKILRRVGN